MLNLGKIRGRLKSGAAFVAFGILLSRLAGLVRERVFAHYLGNSLAAGAFKAAVRIPNFLQNLFGEGVLSASFIPVYARLLAEGEPEVAARLAGVIGAALAALVSVLVALGVLFTPAFVDLVAPGFEGEARSLTIHIVQVLFPGVGLLVLSAWCLGILNSHRKFFLSYAAPVLWNVAMIATLLFFGRRTEQNQLAVYLAWGSVVGCLLQLAIQLPFVFRYGGRIRFGFDLSFPHARTVFRNFGPVLVSRGVVQLSAYIDGMIASFLGAAAVSGLAYAQTIYLLPIGLFGMSIAAAELPEMSSVTTAGSEAHAKLCQRLVGGRRKITFFVVPSVVAFLVLGRFVVAALYETGAFGAEDTLYVWYILLGSVVGLLAATWGRLYSSAFYALGDTKTPLAFAVVRVVLTAALGVLFAFPLRPYLSRLLVLAGLRVPELPHIELMLGAVGLTASAGIAGWIEFLLLQRSLTRRIGSSSIPALFQAKIWALALGASAVALVFHVTFRDFLARPALHHSLGPLLVLGVFGVLYLLGAQVMAVGRR
jgi:putative peptidoglycan lipid II flippase